VRHDQGNRGAWAWEVPSSHLVPPLLSGQLCCVCLDVSPSGVQPQPPFLPSLDFCCSPRPSPSTVPDGRLHQPAGAHSLDQQELRFWIVTTREAATGHVEAWSPPTRPCAAFVFGLAAGLRRRRCRRRFTSSHPAASNAGRNLTGPPSILLSSTARFKPSPAAGNALSCPLAPPPM
jgi:hypothetical protein